MTTTTNDRKRMAEYLRAQAKDCTKDVIEGLKEALNTIEDPMGDMEEAERSVGAALIAMGEARGFVNAATDIESGHDEP